MLNIEYLQLFAGLTQTVRVFFGGLYTHCAHYRSDTYWNDTGGSSSHSLSVMATLDTCNASSKLVILRSQTGSPYGASARIPSIILPGLFVNFPAGQLGTPKATASAFPFSMSEADEPDACVPSPKYFSGQRRQTTIDPTLVSSEPLCAVITLKECSPCTSVRIQPGIYFPHSDLTF